MKKEIITKYKEKITVYQLMLKKLKTKDDKQLLEMLHDLDDLQLVERIGDCAAHYLDSLEGNDTHEYNCYGVKTEAEDAKELDDQQRYNDVTTCDRRPY